LVPADVFQIPQHRKALFVIYPITTNFQKDIEILKVHLKKSQLDKLSDILVDQIRTIDNKRLITKLGQLTNDQRIKLKNNIRIVLDI
jgi:mRNA interferase MazF